MEEIKKVYFNAKFINFDSMNSGIFQLEISLDNSKNNQEFLLIRFSLCMQNNQTLYDDTDILINPILFYKKIVDKKKETSFSIYSRLNLELHDFIKKNFNNLFKLNSKKEIVVNNTLEEEMKEFINKKIAPQIFKPTIDKLGFIYNIAILSYQEEKTLKEKEFKKDEDQENKDEIFKNELYKDCSLVLSPSQGISIFLLEPGDIIFVRTIEKKEIKEDEKNKTNQTNHPSIVGSPSTIQKTVVENIFSIDNAIEITVKFDNGQLGRIEETEMVKVKGIKPKDLKTELTFENDFEKKKSSFFFKEFKKNFFVFLVISIIFSLIIFFLSNF